jgi:hypothetical protein
MIPDRRKNAVCGAYNAINFRYQKKLLAHYQPLVVSMGLVK